MDLKHNDYNKAMNNRSKNFICNVIWELGYYFAVVLLGFLAPRFIILVYGSEVNGLSSTITQILNIILLLQSGATTAAVYSLYKPIAENDIESINMQIASSDRFFKKISYIFLAIMIVVAMTTSVVLNSSLTYSDILIAFVIMGGKSFLDLYFTSKFRIVFIAFQKKYIISIATLVEQVSYYVLVFMTIYMRLHFLFMYVWLFIGCVVKIIILEFEYHKNFANIITKVKGKVSGKIANRNYALANEVSHSVVSSSVTVILSFMYGLSETSVYSIYAMVGQALGLFSTAVYSSFSPSFGNLNASGDKTGTVSVFRIFRFLFLVINTFLYMCMLFLLLPFVAIYTNGAADINYLKFSLAVMLALQGLFSAYRIPYNTLVSTCGLFKETWIQPVVCAFISITVSLVTGRIDYPLIIMGPIFFYLCNFIYQHWRLRGIVPYLIESSIFKLFAISCVGMLLTIVASKFVVFSGGITAWLTNAFICMLVSAVYLFLAVWIFDKEEAILSYHYLLRRIKKKNV